MKRSCVWVTWTRSNWFKHGLSFQQWGLFDKQFGRSDAEEPDPEGQVPQWDKASVQEMKDKFSSVGFGPRQVHMNS